MHTKRTHALLVIVAVLLTANLIFTVAGWLANPRPARADVVEGKNWFSTHSDDGRTVYLWQYWTTGGLGSDAKGQVAYYGRISAGGTFQAN
jgi:hypothetical protein